MWERAAPVKDNWHDAIISPTRETFLGTSREPPMWERAAPVKDNREEP